VHVKKSNFMNVISRKKIDQFTKKHSDSKQQLLSWYRETCHAEWNSPQDIKNRYRSADFLKDNIVIFNIKGNSYRLVVKVAYKTKTVFIKWIGTHAEYSKVSF